ncbi:MAG: hypothetical protein KatS3mg088_001 [Patescibacteria group bacterium]|nr:MAG: hypothetical protein KatS3mg088_001 [Patescibacteria group bacterium]
MHFLKHNFLKFFFPAILLLIWAFVAFRNFVYGTHLLGWDNLLPELNPLENIRRSLSVAWQEYQGLGLLGGMAHASDLPRQVLVLLLSFVLPSNLIRYFLTFLMLFLGPLGVYFFIKDRLSLRSEGMFKQLAGFVGSVFYLFNLATVQYFFVPFEAFVFFYGFLPWFLFFATRYLEKGERRGLVLFILISFLGTTAFYVQTLFLVYVVFLVAFSLEAILRFKKGGFVRVIKLAFITLAVNAFWLLPVAYFALTSSFVNSFSHINSIATPETQFMNQAAGNWWDVLRLKGFWFNYYDFFVDGGHDYLFRDWIGWIDKIEVFWAGVGLSVLSLLGILISLFRKKRVFAASFLILYFISYFMLASKNPPFGGVFEFLVDKFPLFSEIFRSVFTKWSVAFAFVLSCGLGYFVLFFDIFNRRFLRFFISFVFGLLIIFASVFSVWPVFGGNLVAKKMKVNLPNDYLSAVDWFNDKSGGGRIAILPFVNHWGWVFTNWGHSGSGFLWYGVKNPILDRAFDVWSPYNETFYNEASNILYRYYAFDKDRVGPCPNKKECEAGEEELKIIEEWNRRVVEEFENVLAKYQVSYLLLDESIINAGGDNKLLYIPEIKDLISKSSRIKEVARFGFLTIYHFEGTGSDPVQAPREYSLINANLKYSKYDPLYQKYKEYVSFGRVEEQESGRAGEMVDFPFVNFDPRGPVKIEILGSNIEFLNKDTGAKVILPVNEKIEEKFGEDQGFKEGYNCDLKKKGAGFKEPS